AHGCVGYRFPRIETTTGYRPVAVIGAEDEKYPVLHVRDNGTHGRDDAVRLRCVWVVQVVGACHDIQLTVSGSKGRLPLQVRSKHSTYVWKSGPPWMRRRWMIGARKAGML